MGDADLGVYYDAENPGGYGGVARLRSAAKTGKNETAEWLKKQRTYTLHKPDRLRYSTRPYKTAEIDQQWQADLVEMIPYAHVNDDYKYMLTVIDLFSRYAWAKPIKDKTGKAVKHAFQEIFALGRKCQRLQTDDGLEFNNRHVQRLLTRENIKFFIVKSQFKAAVCEIFYRTLKSRMWRYFIRRGSYRRLDVLLHLMREYNAYIYCVICLVFKDGSFYAAELQQVVKPEQYAIEKIIRRKQVRGRMRYYVKWLGFGDDHNSWVDDVGDLE